MRTFIVTGRAASFPAGYVIGISDEQIKRRIHALVVNDEVKAPEGCKAVTVMRLVQFKRGETVSIEGDQIQKAMLAELAEDGTALAEDTLDEVLAARERADARRDGHHAAAVADADRRAELKAAGAPGSTKFNAAVSTVRLAESLGVDLAELTGSGAKGKILAKDVSQAAEAAAQAAGGMTAGQAKDAPEGLPVERAPEPRLV